MVRRFALACVLTGCSVDTFAGDDAATDAPVDSTTKDAASDVIGSSDAIVSDVITLDSPASTKKIVFATSKTYTAALAGSAGADLACAQLALAAGLTGTYVAWLSTSLKSASARLSHSTLPYVLRDNTLIANNWTSLTTSGIQHAINETEDGGVPPITTAPNCSDAGSIVWTGTTPSGAAWSDGGVAAFCDDWLDTATAQTTAGIITNGGNSLSWTETCSGAICANTKAVLYCFEQ